MSKILKPKTISKLPIWGSKYGNITREHFKGKFSKEQIKERAQWISNKMKEAGKEGVVSVALRYPVGWRAGYFSQYGDTVQLYEHSDSDDTTEEPDSYSAFDIYFMKTNNKAGGCDGKWNDCLYYCLKQVLRDKMPWKMPSSFKIWLKLKRNDKVPLDKIAAIEERLKSYKINVRGDHLYISTRPCSLEINLNLLNEHYSLDNSNSIQVKGIAYEEKKPLFYKVVDGKNLCYDGKQQLELSDEEFKEIRTKPRTSEYLLIPASSHESFEAEYKQWIADADILKKESKGLINLYKTGSDHKTALNMFDRFNKTLAADPIKQDEATWIEEAKTGASIWCEKYEGQGYKYDFCSMYPSSMAHKQMKFPIKRGSFSKMTSIETRPQYGIYRCTVEQKEEAKKLFRYNFYDKYTHIDLEVAQSIGLKVKLIQDDQPNALTYERTDLVTGFQLFGEYVKVLFELKQKGVKRAKKILNILWGALCQVNSIPLKVNLDGAEIKENTTIHSIRPLNDETLILELVKNDRYYETNYARIAPFLLARGRYLVGKAIKPHISHIKRVHTDGFISDVKLDIKTGTDLGEIKFEGYSENCKIVNNNKIEGKFIL